MFPTAQTLMIFAASTFVLLVVPGPSVVYVMTRSIEQGRAAGLMAMLGLESGAFVHALLAATGLASVLAASPSAFEAVRWIGAGYLIYLAVRQFRAHPPGADADATSRVSSNWRLYRDGVLVDLLNPKTCVFFVAFLPQFVDASRGSAEGQMMVLGLCFVALAAMCDGAYALVSGGLGGRIRRSNRLSTRVNRSTSAVYLILAAIAIAG